MEHKKFLMGFIIGLLVYVLVASIIGIFGQSWAMRPCLGCAGNPIGEIVSTIQNAQSGTTTSSQMLCFVSAGDSFTQTAIKNKLSDDTEIRQMACSTDPNENTICAGASPAISVTSNEIRAIKAGGAQFKVRVCCGAGCVSNYGTNKTCDITVINSGD